MDARGLLLFVETPHFTTRWQKLGLTDGDLAVLQWSILENPLSGAVIAGTSGFRKLRFSPANSGKGKSGAFRAIYLPIPRLRSIVLGVVFAKSEAGNIDAVAKKMLSKLGGVYELLLDRHFKGEQQ